MLCCIFTNLPLPSLVSLQQFFIFRKSFQHHIFLPYLYICCCTIFLLDELLCHLCFSFWSLAGRCFYETLGETFCLICTVCIWYTFIYLLSSRDARYKPYFTATTAVTGIKACPRHCLCAFIWSCSGIYWPVSAGQVENTTRQIFPNLVQLLWQVTNRAAKL